MKYSSLSIITLSIASSIGLSGCLLKDMKEMHDATVGMSSKTDQMSAKMDNTNNGVKHAGETGDLTYTSLQKATAKQLREGAFKELRDLEEIGAKYSSATAYIYAFQFQEWNPKYQTEEDRESMYYQAVAEYVKIVKEFINNRSETNATSSNERMLNLYAITAVMHRISPRQEELSKLYGFKQVSMFDLLAEAMNYDPHAEGAIPESQLPLYMIEARREMPDVTYLMRVRQNFLLALSYVKLAGPANGDEFKLLEKFWKKVKYQWVNNAPEWIQKIIGSTTWVPDYDSRNYSQIDYIAQILDRAITTHDLLTHNGLDPMMDETILAFLSRGELKKATAKDPLKQEAIVRVEDNLSTVFKTKNAQ